MENKIISLEKSNSKIKLVNNIILITAIVGIIIAGIILILTNGTTQEGPEQIGLIFVIVILGFMTFAGIGSVVMSNNKSPMGLLVLSSIATLFKLMYPVIQISTGQENINSSVLIGQTISFFTLMIQVYFGIKGNKEQEDGKFISEMFNGKRTYIALGIITSIIFAQITLSIIVNGVENLLIIFIDVLGAGLYTIASILMAFGNIGCFLFFFLSDMNGLYGTITDLISQTSLLMTTMALLTTIQVLAYSGLAITGGLQGLNDNKSKKLIQNN